MIMFGYHVILRDIGGYNLVVILLFIPTFRFKASPCIYQTVGIVVTSYFQSLSLSTVQYIHEKLVIAKVSGVVYLLLKIA